MKKLFLVVACGVMGLQASDDIAVYRGAGGGLANTAVDQLAIHTGKSAGKRAGRILDNWFDRGCQRCFGVSGDEAVNNAFKAVLITAMAYGAYKTGEYFVNRESNDSKVRRALGIWNQVSKDLNSISTLANLRNFLYKFDHLNELVMESYGELTGRYTSWVTPWNWTNDMKDAHEKMTFLYALFKYKEVLNMLEYGESDLIKVAAATYSLQTAYPVCEYVTKLQADIAALKSISRHSASKCLNIMLQELHMILKVFASSETYVQEHRMLQTAIAQERLASAIEASRYR